MMEAAAKRRAAGLAPKLHTLVLSRNLLGDGSADAWAGVISAHRASLRRFESNRNDFRESGILAVANALSRCAGLRYLTIEDAVVANIDNDGVEGLARGWKAVADVVRASPSLRVLHLPSCSFRTDGCDEMMKVLNERSRPTLKSIRLEHNDLTEVHFEALLSAVQRNLPALKFLRVTVDDETEDSESLKKIKDILDSRKGKLVVLHENDFSDEEDGTCPASDDDELEEADTGPASDTIRDLVEELKKLDV